MRGWEPPSSARSSRERSMVRSSRSPSSFSSRTWTRTSLGWSPGRSSPAPNTSTSIWGGSSSAGGRSMPICCPWARASRRSRIARRARLPRRSPPSAWSFSASRRCSASSRWRISSAACCLRSISSSESAGIQGWFGSPGRIISMASMIWGAGSTSASSASSGRACSRSSTASVTPSRSPDPRRTLTSTLVPACSLASCSRPSGVDRRIAPTWVMTSPAWIPAASAGPPSMRAVTSRPWSVASM